MRKKNRMSWTECSSQTVCGRTISAESDPLLLNFQQHPNQEHRLKWMMIAKTLVHFVLSWLNNTDRQTDRPLASDHYRSEWLSLSSLFSSIHHHQLWYNRSSQLEVKKGLMNLMTPQFLTSLTLSRSPFFWVSFSHHPTTTITTCGHCYSSSSFIFCWFLICLSFSALFCIFYLSLPIIFLLFNSFFSLTCCCLFPSFSPFLDCLWTLLQV